MGQTSSKASHVGSPQTTTPEFSYENALTNFVEPFSSLPDAVSILSCLAVGNERPISLPAPTGSWPINPPPSYFLNGGALTDEERAMLYS